MAPSQGSQGTPQLINRFLKQEMTRQRKEMNTVNTTSLFMIPIVVGLTVAIFLIGFFLIMAFVLIPLSNLVVPSEPLMNSTQGSWRPRRALASRLLMTTRGLKFTENFLISPITYITGFNAFLGVLLLIVWVDPRPTRCRKTSDSPYKLVAALIYAALLGFSYGTTFVQFQPLLFWLLYSVLSAVIIALLANAYVPNTAYYSDLEHTRYEHWWTRPRFPTFLHALLSLLLIKIGPPFGFLLDTCTEMVSNRWLWKGLSPTEQTTAIAVLTALGNRDERRARSILIGQPPAIAGKIVYVLSKLNLALPAQRQLQLTSRGEQLVQAAMRSP
ncbi:MAG: hypothetical protein AAGA75_08635 [Cyanobacteria bacterium P01_E01_bin.6]